MKTGESMMHRKNWVVAVLATTVMLAGTLAPAQDNLLRVVCPENLNALAEKLADDFNRTHPDWKADVSVITQGNPMQLDGESVIGLVDKTGISRISSRGGYSMVAGRDVIVPVINTNNPNAADILSQGITPGMFAKIYTSPVEMTWGEVLGNNDGIVIETYLPAAAIHRTYLAEFAGTDPDGLTGTIAGGDEALLGALRDGNRSVGFCSLTCLARLEKEGTMAGITLVPLDVDGNRQVDHFENMYHSCGDLAHAIFVGKYPRALYSRIYAVTSVEPVDGAAAAFLDWLATEGQASLSSAGILPLDLTEQLAYLHPATPSITSERTAGKSHVSVIVLLVLTLVVLTGTGILFRPRKQKLALAAASIAPATFFGQDTADFPRGLYFDKSHTWTFLERDGSVRIGIDDFLQHVTGSITRVKVKKQGEKLNRGEPFVNLVQHGKQLEINSPVSGTVSVVNNALLTEASVLNSDPYNGGWICTVQPSCWLSDLGNYLMGERYREWLRTEFNRLRDFLASLMEPEKGDEGSLVLQDGGEISDGVLETFSPEVWEEFQIRFINRAI
jgi:glycine cleavage system H lipoate-binding protein/ABC-type phosphate transport system substrate-binding protein